MTHVMDLPAVIEEIGRFRRLMKASFTCFDPGDLEEAYLPWYAADALKAGQTFWVTRERRPEHRHRHVALQLGVRCPIDLAHAARPERCDDLVETQLRPGRQGHGLPPARTNSPSSSNQLKTKHRWLRSTTSCAPSSLTKTNWLPSGETS